MITFTIGDDVTLQLQVSPAIDLSAATFQSKLMFPTPVTIANAKHTADGDQVANKGKFTITLSNTDTASLPLAGGVAIKTRVTIAGKVKTFAATNLITTLSY